MKPYKEYFALDIRDLQGAVVWAIDYVERAASIYEHYAPEDPRVRNAIAEARRFSESGKRTMLLRKLAMDAYRASREIELPAASFAANAASLVAAVAYTHPYRDLRQAEHLLGPIVYSVLSLESEREDTSVGEREIEKAVDGVPERVALLLGEYPRHEMGSGRVAELLYRLDSGIAG
jgi:hypothetical protein